MKKITGDAKCSVYLWSALILFFTFWLEFISLFTIEPLIFGIPLNDYSNDPWGAHWLITTVLWLTLAFLLVRYTKHNYGFPAKQEINERLEPKDWLILVVGMVVSKVITYIDWGTLKIIGEFQIKADVFKFASQYIYYFAEVMIVCLIVIYGQKAFETRSGERSTIPYGGIVLALTWGGGIHFVSNFQGIQLWNGISAMISAFVFGVCYLSMKRRKTMFFLFVAIAFLL